MLRIRHALLLGIGLAAGCTSIAGGPAAELVAEHLDLPCATAALMAATAARAALPCADPAPWHGGAPVQARDDQTFALRYESDGTATVPVADHRILGTGADVRLLAERGLPGGFGRAVLALELHPEAGGTALRGRIDGAVAARFRAALATALAPPRTTLTASSTDDPIDSRKNREHAAIACADPAMRAAMLATMLPEAADGPRTAAWNCLARGDLAAARVLLHSARRNGTDPGADYTLAAALHAQDDDPMSTFAFRLLAREHERTEASPLATAPAR